MTNGGVAGSEQCDDPESLVSKPSRWSDPANQRRLDGFEMHSDIHNGNLRPFDFID